MFKNQKKNYKNTRVEYIYLIRVVRIILILHSTTILCENKYITSIKCTY